MKIEERKRIISRLEEAKKFLENAIEDNYNLYYCNLCSVFTEEKYLERYCPLNIKIYVIIHEAFNLHFFNYRYTGIFWWKNKYDPKPRLEWVEKRLSVENFKLKIQLWIKHNVLLLLKD